CARARNWSSVQPALATPMTGTFSSPRAAIACSDGKIFLYARSPVAPKNTSASERVALMPTADGLCRVASRTPCPGFPVAPDERVRRAVVRQLLDRPGVRHLVDRPG